MKRFPHKSASFLLMSFLLLGASSTAALPDSTLGDTDSGASTATKCKMSYEFRGDKDDYDIWYSDDYFRAASTQYNPHLATLSVWASKFSMNPGDPRGYDDSEWYENQWKRPEAFYKSIGFQLFTPNEDYKTRTTFDTIGIGCALRYIDGVPVIACVIRSGGYFNEWENNIFLGDGSNSDMMHEGWYNAANKTIDFINQYIQRCQIAESKIKLWISGFSRGGAVSNVAAGLIDNKFGEDGTCKMGSGNNTPSLHHDDFYAYTFETPQGANINSKNVKHPKDEIYNNIFNIINPNDLVPKVAMSQFGFTRFGIDRFVVSRFFAPKRYDASRKSAAALGPEKNWDFEEITMYNLPAIKILVDATNFISFAIDLITTFVDTGTTAFPGFFEEDTTKKKYDPNVILTILMDEAMSQMGSRSVFCAMYQTPLRALVARATSDAKGAEKGANITSFIFQLLLGSMAMAAFGPLASLFNIFTDDIFTLEQLDPVFTLIGGVSLVYPNEFISFLGNISNIFDYHGTNLCVEFVKAQDSLYVDDYNASHADDKIELVPFLHSASFKRAEFYDFNELSLYNCDDKNTKTIEIIGHLIGKSDIEHCHFGYAAGYYSYSTTEKLEIFFPACYKVRCTFNDWTKTMYKRVWAKGYYYRNHNEKTDNDRYYKQKWDIYDDWVFYGGSEQSQTWQASESPEA